MADSRTSNKESAMPWVQLFVKGDSVSPQAMQRAEELVSRFGALVVSLPPAGVPTKNAQGEYEVRLLSEGAQGMVRRVLEGHCSLVVTREIIHPD